MANGSACFPPVALVLCAVTFRNESIQMKINSLRKGIKDEKGIVSTKREASINKKLLMEILQRCFIMFDRPQIGTTVSMQIKKVNQTLEKR